MKKKIVMMVMMVSMCVVMLNGFDLEGKWVSINDNNNYMFFERVNYDKPINLKEELYIMRANTGDQLRFYFDTSSYPTVTLFSFDTKEEWMSLVIYDKSEIISGEYGMMIGTKLFLRQE